MNAKADLAKLRAARNRASKAYRARQKEAGEQEVRVMLPAHIVERLDLQAAVHGSRAKALERMIMDTPTNSAVWRAGDVAEPMERKVLAKIGPVTDMKTGVTMVDYLVEGVAVDLPSGALEAQEPTRTTKAKTLTVAPQARRSTKASVGGRTGASAESASRPTEQETSANTSARHVVQLGPTPRRPGEGLKKPKGSK